MLVFYLAVILQSKSGDFNCDRFAERPLLTSLQDTGPFVALTAGLHSEAQYAEFLICRFSEFQKGKLFAPRVRGRPCGTGEQLTTLFYELNF